jgi:AraC-like DNA-binding protein
MIHGLSMQPIVSSYGALLERRELLFSVLELFPLPIEVFAPDGISLFVNSAFLKAFHIPDSSEVVGKFNVLKDGYVNQTPMLAEFMRRVFSGELLTIYDIKVPFNEIYSFYFSKYGNPAQNDMYHDITGFPLRNAGGEIGCVVTIFMTTGIYHSRLDAIKAAEYIKENWLDDFNIDNIARAAGLSRHYLTRLFKKYTGMTPYSYYQDVKIEKIKEALRDTGISVSKAFLLCGVDYSGRFADIFKKKTGMTPSQYRKSLRTGEGEQVREHTSDAATIVREQDPSLVNPRAVSESKELLFEVASLFPIPVQIYKSNGDIVYINESVLRMWNIQDTSQLLGHYNLLSDPFVNEQCGLKDYIIRAFQGEIVLISDIKVPLEQLWQRYKTRNGVYNIESLYVDILNFPVFSSGGEMIYMVSMFFTSRVYQGRPDIVKAREYIENNWREEFDMNKLSEAMRISPSHLARLFKRHTGMTPYSYYQKTKINRLKKAIQDKTMSIAEAFEYCGLEYSGNFARVFKEQIGMTPSQYRKSMDK